MVSELCSVRCVAYKVFGIGRWSVAGFDPGRPLQNSSKNCPKKSRSYRAVNSGPLPLELKIAENVPGLRANSPKIFGFHERVAPNCGINRGPNKFRNCGGAAVNKVTSGVSDCIHPFR